MVNQFTDLLMLFGVMILQVVIPPLPAELIVVSAGRLYGSFWTTVVAGSGLFVGSVLVYLIGKFIHRKFDRFFDRAKTKKVMTRLRRFETPILWVRILPYNPSDLISYAAGIMQIRFGKFLLISVITSYTRTLLLALLGMHISNIKTLLQVISILLISALIGSAAVYGAGKNSRWSRTGKSS